MRREFSPAEYLSLSDAVRMVAKIPEYSDSDNEWLDVGDHLNDAEALDLATKKLRQWLCDGELTAYTRDLRGKKINVPEWTWTDDKACLADRSGDEQFRGFQFFSADGVKIEEKWFPVFVLEREFEPLCAGGVNTSQSEQPEAKRRAGRPKGSGFNDEPWLNKIEKLVLDGMAPFTAATEVVAKFDKSIERKSTTKSQHVSDRLHQKYMTSGRPKKPTQTN